MFDGHCGTRAAKFASRALHLNLDLFLNAQATDSRSSDDAGDSGNGNPSSSSSPSDRRNASIERAVRAAFRKTQNDFLDDGGASSGGGGSGTRHSDADRRQEEQSQPSPTDEPERKSSPDPSPSAGDDSTGRADVGPAATTEDDSGTTATVALVYADVTVVAHVGDSRAVMCCDEAGRAVEITEGKGERTTAMQPCFHARYDGSDNLFARFFAA